jgi:hypothetical protein
MCKKFILILLYLLIMLKLLVSHQLLQQFKHVNQCELSLDYKEGTEVLPSHFFSRFNCSKIHIYTQKMLASVTAEHSSQVLTSLRTEF